MTHPPTPLQATPQERDSAPPGRDSAQVWAYFARPLEHPAKIPQGATVRLTPEELADLKAGDPEAVLDVTPRPQALALAAAGVLRGQGTMALLVKHLCGSCGLRQGARFVVCEECRDARFVWLPQSPSPALAAASGLRFRAVVQLALAWARGEYRDCPTLEHWQLALRGEAEATAVTPTLK